MQKLQLCHFSAHSDTVTQTSISRPTLAEICDLTNFTNDDDYLSCTFLFGSGEEVILHFIPTATLQINITPLYHDDNPDANDYNIIPDIDVFDYTSDSDDSTNSDSSTASSDASILDDVQWCSWRSHAWHTYLTKWSMTHMLWPNKQ